MRFSARASFATGFALRAFAAASLARACHGALPANALTRLLAAARATWLSILISRAEGDFRDALLIDDDDFSLLTFTAIRRPA